MGKRARAKKVEERQLAATLRRQKKIEDGWKPPTKAEIDEKIANRQCDGQDRVREAQERKTRRAVQKEVAKKKAETITQRLIGFFSGQSKEERADELIKQAEERRKQRAAKRKLPDVD